MTEPPRFPAPTPAFEQRFPGLREIEHTGYGSVGTGVDQTSGRHVTVRVLRSPRFSHGPATADELRDAVTRGFAVVHRGIAGPIDVAIDAHSGTAFVVFDTVPHLTLEDVARAQADSRTRPIALLATVAEALIAARSTSSVHGTLHPRAVHVGVVGTVERAVITDMELGPFLRIAALDAGVRDAPFFAYASPQLLENPASGGIPRDDVYAIGAMAYEILSGKRPHPGSTVDVLVLQRKNDPPDLREPHFQVPLPLATVVMRALTVEPVERPSMRELVAALHNGATDLTLREHATPKPVAATRDATMVVERADLEAALKNARLRKPEAPKRRRLVGEGWAIGLSALGLAGLMSFVTRHDAREDGILRVTTRPDDPDGGLVPAVRLFVDGRFRGMVERDERRDVAIPVGSHRVVLRFDDGGVAATRTITVGARTRVDLPVPAERPPDPAELFRNESENRFETRCVGIWHGAVDPGHRAVTATLVAHPTDGSCGTLDAGRMGTGPLESCAFDGESLLLAQVTLAHRQTFAVRLECKPDGDLTLLEPRARGDLLRDPLDGGVLGDGDVSDAAR